MCTFIIGYSSSEPSSEHFHGIGTRQNDVLLNMLNGALHKMA